MEKTNEKKSLQEKYFKLANKKFLDDAQMGDRQTFMSNDIFTLNIFDEEVKKQILNNSKEKISANKLNKLVILLKYFLRTGISNYHFKNNEFTKKFVYSDNRTINSCLDILKEANLIDYSIYIKKNSQIRGYFINPTKALQFAISLKEDNTFTRNTKANDEVEIMVSCLEDEKDSFEDNPFEILKSDEKELEKLKDDCKRFREELREAEEEYEATKKATNKETDEEPKTFHFEKMYIQNADIRFLKKMIEYLKHKIDFCEDENVKQQLQKELLEEENFLYDIQNTSLDDFKKYWI